jgi:hypothetical protein
MCRVTSCISCNKRKFCYCMLLFHLPSDILGPQETGERDCASCHTSLFSLPVCWILGAAAILIQYLNGWFIIPVQPSHANHSSRARPLPTTLFPFMEFMTHIMSLNLRKRRSELGSRILVIKLVQIAAPTRPTADLCQCHWGALQLALSEV